MTSPVEIAVVDYGMGNLSSVRNAFAHIGYKPFLTDAADKLEKADIIVLPGVGAFGEAMENLRELGLVEVLTREVMKNKKPFLGICLGMQLIAKCSEEKGNFSGLGWIDAEVRRIPVPSGVRLPHIGWNNIDVRDPCPLFSGIEPDRNFYFVHSYRVECSDEIVMATCDYNGIPIVSMISHNNIMATQFHPEKSHSNGLELLENFIKHALRGLSC